MKLLTAPKYLSDAISPIVTLNYLVGLRIFEYPRGKLRIVPSLIYLLFLLSVFCVSTNAEIIFFNDDILHDNMLKLERVLYKFLANIKVFFTVYEMLHGYFYTKTVNACYRKMIQIDETLRQLGSMFNYNGIYFLSIGSVVVWFLYILCISILREEEMKDYESDLLSVIWIVISDIQATSIRLLVIFEFSIFVRYLQTRFKLLNKLLTETRFKLLNELLTENVEVSMTEEKKRNHFAIKDHAESIDGKQHQNIFSIKVLSQLNPQLQSRIRISISGKRDLIRSRTQSRLPSQFQKLFQMEFQSQFKNQFRDSNSVRRQTHLELCKILKTLCISFGSQIITKYVIFEAFGEIIYSSSYILVIVLINFVCKHATNEGMKTSAIIHEIYGCCPDTDIREEIQQFDLQIAQSPVQFFMFGILLNYPFLSSCLNTVTIYVVIMIQMSNSLESNKNS
ncbi:PREDICTED: uncharacterized protein LOC106748745 [Dinoponera quadriceps]|uniref:Gustatory receptor n=1 Tax=Dinoponera quadriceps TaxID=609295 RepID=A0A6P3XWZ4_DINQU|nr:PREDICTED: uncharacterized protein LOC106748745 [Dinoponera quadriceps]